MSARTVLAAALTADLPTFDVIGYPTTPDAVTRPTVLLWQSSVRRHPSAPDSGVFEVDIELWVLVGTEGVTRVDDALDDALDQVLGVLNARPDFLWESADRQTLADRYHGYKITAKAVGRITP